MKSLAICSTLLVSSALARADGWEGVWKLKPLSTSDKCCYFEEIVSIRDFGIDKDKVWVEGTYMTETPGCKKNYYISKNKFLKTADSATTITLGDIFGTVELKGKTADLKSTVSGEQCDATLTLDNSLISWDGKYTVDTIEDGCCKPKFFTLKTEGGKVSAKGAWDDSDACKKLSLTGDISSTAGTRTNEAYWNYLIKDSDGKDWISKIELLKWSSKLDFRFSQGWGKDCKGNVTVTALPKDAEKPGDKGKDDGGSGWVVPVVIVIILILIAVAVGGYFLYRKKQAEKLKAHMGYAGLHA